MAKRAVLVGVNQYPQSPLRGCINDVSAMYDLLTQHLGFHADDVRVVVDQRATTQAIKERLDWLTRDLKVGDVAVFHFSGHGSQCRDRSGDELGDSLDELICPVDLDWAEKMILDDDIAAYMSRVPLGAFVTMLLDACHSGTGSRFLRPPEEDAGNPHPESYRKARFLTPPFDIEARSTGRDLPRRRFGRAQPVKGTRAHVPRPTPRGFWGWVWKWLQPKVPATVKVVSVPEMNHALAAGCRADQTSADAFIGGKYCGAMTYHFVKAVRENPGKTLAEVHAIARQAILGAGYSQESQLEGPEGLLNRPVFS